MTTITLPNQQELLMIGVPKDAIGFVIDNAIEFLIYKIPNYKNWCTDDVLENYDKLQKYLANTKDGDDYLTTGKRLHGKHEILGTHSPLKQEFFLVENAAAKDWIKEYWRTATEPLLSLLEAEAGKHEQKHEKYLIVLKKK